MKITVLKGNFISAPSLGELEIRENSFMVLEDGAIAGIFSSLPEKYSGAQIEDFSNCLIMQSFCDMHLHAPQYPMLGMGMDLPLLDWLNTYTFKTEARFEDDEYAREVYKKLARELVEMGTTRVCMFSSIHPRATLILMEELENAGVTGFVGKVNMDRNGASGLQETMDSSIRDTIYWLDECGRFKNIKPIITPRFTPSCSDGLMEELGKIAQARGLPVQSHLSENTSEIQWVKELCPDCRGYWQSYQKHGLWKERTVMAHCVHCDEDEKNALRDAGVVAAHCADSNINLCSGVAPVREMLERGIWVVLGSDIAGGAELSMMDVITKTIRASKIKRIESGWKTDFLSVAEAYYLATTSAHMYFGAKPGFAKGNMLHAVVIDDGAFCTPRVLSMRERFERSLYLAEKTDICAVYSEGVKRVSRDC